jgi:hypothetical protein
MKNMQQRQKHYTYFTWRFEAEEELQQQVQTVKTFSDDIHMEFGLGQVCENYTEEEHQFSRKI